MMANTRDLLIDAAERLFAAQGFESATIRGITREAGANVAAAHYHFGSKEALLRAVLDRYIGPLNGRRIELLDAAVREAGSAPVAVDALLRAFLLPDLETIKALRDRGVVVAHLMGRSYTQHDPFMQQLMAEQFAEVRARFFPEFARALPHLSLDEIEWRMRCVVGVIVAMFAAATPRGVPGPFNTANTGVTLDRLVAFASAGLSTPHAADLEGALEAGQEVPPPPS